MSGKIFDFDDSWFENVSIVTPAVKESVRLICESALLLSKDEKISLLLKAIQCIDLTTLSGDDTHVNVQRLCCRAINPLRSTLANQLMPSRSHQHVIHTAAVCVYPSRVTDCVQAFDKLNPSSRPININIASVATGFPSGQYSLESRLKEIEYATSCGANEIDVVINRSLAIAGDWNGVYEEVKAMKLECVKGNAHLKVILAAGELGSLENIYKASVAAMLGGADFIKTSTGKETINATLTIGITMTRAIWDFHEATGVKVGFKPAGGLKTAEDTLNWLVMMRVQLGNDWMNHQLFRIGASSLLNDIEKQLFKLTFGRNAMHHELSL